eukprot:7935944-Pyramimonas_sp.AAC.1
MWALRRPLGAFLEPSEGPLERAGRLLGEPQGALGGPSWGPLGLLGRLGLLSEAVVGPLGTIAG